MTRSWTGRLPIPVRLGGLRFFGDRAGVLAWAVDDGACPEGAAVRA